MDMASSIQAVTEEIVIKLVKDLQNKFKIKNLCLAGGVALNCVANGKILKEKIFENLWIQPAAGDAGGSLGAALAYWYHELNMPRDQYYDRMRGAYLGPKFNDQDIEQQLNSLNAKYGKKIQMKYQKKWQESYLIIKMGWFQGRMEFGPRALEEICTADPRSEKMQKELNLKIKFRKVLVLSLHQY